MVNSSEDKAGEAGLGPGRGEGLILKQRGKMTKVTFVLNEERRESRGTSWVRHTVGDGGGMTRREAASSRRGGWGVTLHPSLESGRGQGTYLAKAVQGVGSRVPAVMDTHGGGGEGVLPLQQHPEVAPGQSWG